jgi:hypothetical protein
MKLEQSARREAKVGFTFGVVPITNRRQFPALQAGAAALGTRSAEYTVLPAMLARRILLNFTFWQISGNRVQRIV